MLPEWHMHTIKKLCIENSLISKKVDIFSSLFSFSFTHYQCECECECECGFMSVNFSNESDKSAKLQECINGINARMKKYIWIIKALFYQRDSMCVRVTNTQRVCDDE